MRSLLFFAPLLSIPVACTSTSSMPSDGGNDDQTMLDAGLADHVYSQDATVCAPRDVTGFMPPALVPPLPAQDVCVPAQIQAFWTKCVSDQSTLTECQLWGAANKSCGACLATADSSVNWGALVLFADGYHPNTSGCIATLGYLDCAKAIDALGACTTAACHDNCPPDPDDGGTAALEACRTAASTSTCKMYQSTVDAVCPMDASSIALCLQGGLQKFYMAFAPILCSSGG